MRKITLYFFVFLLAGGVSVNSQDNLAGNIEPYNIKTDLLGLSPDLYLLPEDFAVGPLTDSSVLISDEKEIYDNILTVFFDGLMNSKIRKELIQPETYLAVERNLISGLFDKDKSILTGYRTGPIFISGKTARVRVKLVSGSSYAVGNVYLIYYSDGKWYITDLEIDFDDFKETQKKEGVFSPASLITY